MRFITQVAALCLAFAGTALAGSPYNLTVIYNLAGYTQTQRVWYGDGNLYVGQTVPSNVKTAFNFTVPNQRADLVYIQPLDPAITLPDPTFLALNNAPGALGPLFFTHSLAAAPAGPVPADYIVYFAAYEFVLFAILDDGSLQNYLYLDATDAPGTYILKWRGGGPVSTIPATAESLVGVSVELYTRASGA